MPNESVSPLFDPAIEVDFFGVCSEIIDNVVFVRGGFIGSELLENLSDFVAVLQSIPIEQVEDDRRVQRGSFISVDEWMVGDEESE